MTRFARLLSVTGQSLTRYVSGSGARHSREPRRSFREFPCNVSSRLLAGAGRGSHVWVSSVASHPHSDALCHRAPAMFTGVASRHAPDPYGQVFQLPETTHGSVSVRLTFASSSTSRILGYFARFAHSISFGHARLPQAADALMSCLRQALEHASPTCSQTTSRTAA